MRLKKSALSAFLKKYTYAWKNFYNLFPRAGGGGDNNIIIIIAGHTVAFNPFNPFPERLRPPAL